jgi:hypothetical protein
LVIAVVYCFIFIALFVLLTLAFFLQHCFLVVEFAEVYFELFIFLLEAVEVFLFLFQVFEHDGSIIFIDDDFRPLLDFVHFFLFFARRVL